MQNLGEVPLWRWLFFIAWCLPLFSATRFCIFLSFMALETRFFISKRFLYYLIGIKVCSRAVPATCSLDLYQHVEVYLQHWALSAPAADMCTLHAGA